MSSLKRSNVVIIHPDLGIGGAERLIIDVALALQSRGHQVAIYTSHRDKTHCFEEARDGTLDVRVRGNTLFPAHVCGRLHVLMAVLRQLHLTVSLLAEMGRTEKESKILLEDDVFIIDQVPACVPILKILGLRLGGRCDDSRRPHQQRILFYCHFPDQLLARRDEGSALIRLVKRVYRYPFDWFEGWAMSASDKVVANSKFTRGVVSAVFGPDRLGDVGIVYPCVDTNTDDVQQGAGKGHEKKPNEDLVSEGNLWGGKKIVLSINRFERKKGVGLAIRAYHGLGEEEWRGTRLVIAGGYDNRVQENLQCHKELDTLAQRLGLQTATSKTVISALSIPDTIDVLFLLSVPSAFKQTLLRNAKLLLYTPKHEHFGIVPVEAMHAGLPVLASNTGGPLETVVEGETGWLRDAEKVEDWTTVMKTVLFEMNDMDLARMALNGRERVAHHFSLTAMGDKLEAEIQDMFGAERRPFLGYQQILVGLVLSGIAFSIFAAMVLKVI